MNLLNVNRAQVAVAVSLALGSTLAAAQSTPTIGDALRQVQPPVLPTKPSPALPSVGGTSQIEAPMSALQGGAQVAVKQIEVIGNRVIDTAKLIALVADGAGKSLTLTELEGLAQRITKYYRANGYFVARAYIPAQEASNGTIKIRVVEGNYGQFHLKNQSLVRDDIVQGMLDDVKSADIVSLDTLERAMLIINDTPGVRVIRADVMPGTKVGTSDFAVDTQATAAYDGYVLLDNYGSVYTGKNRISFNADANSVTGRGDRLALSGLATDGGGLLNARLGYGLLLAPNGLRGEVAISQTQYQLGDTYSSLNAKGTARALDATMTYPVRRIRAQTIEASMNLAYKDLEDKIDSTGTRTPKTSSAVTFGLLVRDESQVLGLDGLTRFSLNLTAGELRINDAAARALDAAGANTQGSFSKAHVSLSRVSLLPNAFSLTTALSTQQVITNKNLDGSERMTVSGSNGVMAYPSGELIGSNATLVHLELARPLPALGKLQSNWQVFGNWGQASAAKSLATEKTRKLSDVGIGWAANYGDAIIKAHLAHRLENTPSLSEKTDRDNFLVQVGWLF
ncbi:hemolysin activation/secretion protein [Actimicrobium sp. GrIS 1.19]|uniref:ShlB/FhaC/HecB family hemolysin secretion/activation protein n=1 Tax=Actimicrobium sp. GrIS 1.19 TaxID=3071708 RepID=UPI002E02B3ED|nr:hemolysin activation/secretion protein [Actimicrobium sp. GrIS 1.19]